MTPEQYTALRSRVMAMAGTREVSRVVTVRELDALLNRPLLDRKLAHIRDCIDEADREHSPEEVAAAAERLADYRQDR